jgi:hypothetical protein
MTPPERRQAMPASDFLGAFLKPGKPVLITDEVLRWNAFRSWDAESLNERFGTRTIQCYYHEDALYTAWKRMRMATTLGNVLSARDPRMFVSARAMSDCAYLVPDFDLPTSIDPKWAVGDAIVWMQHAGHRTGLHWDSYHSMIGVIRGEKRVLLCSPDQYPNL